MLTLCFTESLGLQSTGHWLFNWEDIFVNLLPHQLYLLLLNLNYVLEFLHVTSLKNSKMEQMSDVFSQNWSLHSCRYLVLWPLRVSKVSVHVRSSLWLLNEGLPIITHNKLRVFFGACDMCYCIKDNVFWKSSRWRAWPEICSCIDGQLSLLCVFQWHGTYSTFISITSLISLILAVIDYMVRLDKTDCVNSLWARGIENQWVRGCASKIFNLDLFNRDFVFCVPLYIKPSPTLLLRAIPRCQQLTIHN